MAGSYERTVFGTDTYNACDHGLTYIDWWRDLNYRLASMGHEGANNGDAAYYYRSSHWPSTAAALIAEERDHAARAA